MAMRKAVRLRAFCADFLESWSIHREGSFLPVKRGDGILVAEFIGWAVVFDVPPGIGSVHVAFVPLVKAAGGVEPQ